MPGRLISVLISQRLLAGLVLQCGFGMVVGRPGCSVDYGSIVAKEGFDGMKARTCCEQVIPLVRPICCGTVWFCRSILRLCREHTAGHGKGYRLITSTNILNWAGSRCMQSRVLWVLMPGHIYIGCCNDSVQNCSQVKKCRGERRHAAPLHGPGFGQMERDASSVSSEATGS
jgi:hypothetical protein